MSPFRQSVPQLPTGLVNKGEGNVKQFAEWVMNNKKAVATIIAVGGGALAVFWKQVVAIVEAVGGLS